jgi:hypothetical protein
MSSANSATASVSAKPRSTDREDRITGARVAGHPGPSGGKDLADPDAHTGKSDNGDAGARGP